MPRAAEPWRPRADSRARRSHALTLAPAAQAAGPVLTFPASWLEIGLERIAGWWQEVTAPRQNFVAGPFDAKISTSIDPNGAPSAAPPPANSSKDIGGGIDPNG